MGFVCAVLLIHVKVEELDHTVMPSTVYANVQLVWQHVNSQKIVIAMKIYVSVGLGFPVLQIQVRVSVIPLPINANAP